LLVRGIEIWRPVVGYEGYYEVSNMGRIRSLDRVVWGKSKRGMWYSSVREGKMFSKPDEGDRTYKTVGMNKPGGKSKNCGVHWVVLEAFVGPRPEGMEGCHNDGNPSNNRLDNLRWDTHKGNHEDRIRHGTNNGGEKNGATRLTESDVVEIRRLYSTGEYLMSELAKQYQMTDMGIRTLIRGITWSHVTYLPESNFGRGIDRLNRLEKLKREQQDRKE